LTVLFDLAFVTFKSFAVVSDFDIAHAAITCHVVHVQRLVSFKFQRPQITVVTDRPTDRPHYFVGNNRLYLRTVMQLKTVDIIINFLSKFSEKKIFLKCEII